MVKYTNSSLIDVTILSPNHYTGRTCGYAGHDEGIYIFTPHCMAYNGTVESCGNVFKNPARNASSNYGIDGLGRRALYVEEKNASWCSSNRENDMHAITVEIACNDTHPYVMTDKAIESYIELTVDCMKRNKLTKITYLGSLEATRSYKRANGEALMTLHRWFAAKACPGDYFVSKIPYIISEINKRIKPDPKPLVRLGKLTVVGDLINVRESPNASSKICKEKYKGDVINVVSLIGKWYKTIKGNYIYKDSNVEYKPSTHETLKICNIFSKPNTNSKILIKIPAGAKVLYVSDKGNGWSEVWYSGHSGYIKNCRLKSNAKLSVYPTYKVKSEVWLRTKPSLLAIDKSKIKLKKNTEVHLVCVYNSAYCQVMYNDKEYFVRKSKLNIK